MNHPSTSAAGRNRNLDLLRASAILMVVLGHLMVQSPILLPGLRRITDYGQSGVDLFFVLSGWLIGGLYWREQRARGSVVMLRFWVRRWLRTIPPYLVALAIASLGAYVLRRQAFDFHYLLFIQNYYETIEDYFTASWSLCVEEHFYLLAPLLFLALRGGTGRRGTIACLLLLVLASPVLRLVEYPNLKYPFAYTYTASHLRMDGLVAGCLLSFLASEAPGGFSLLSRFAPFALPVLFALLIASDRAGGMLHYVLTGSIMALFFSAILLVAVSCREISSALAIISGPIALSSYSVYLTHAWGLTLGRVTAGYTAVPATYFLVAVTAIALLGAGFYLLIERPSIRFRDASWPGMARGSVTPMGTAPVRS
jgi:peptidoglycan/LPS O-acetylase OafA/YrhL